MSVEEGNRRLHQEGDKQMKTTCPYCNYKATNHETLDNQKYPKEGDISFCIKCGEVSKYKDHNLVKVDVNKLDKSNIKEIHKIMYAWIKTNPKF